MARHRSPSGRRAHLGLPLTAALAAAGAGGGATRPHSRAANRVAATPFAEVVASTPLRAVAAVVAGGALAAAGQQALDGSLPAVLDGLGGAFGAAATVDVPADQVAPAGLASTLATELPQTAASAVDHIAPEPQIADAAALIKAADLNQAAQQAAAQKASADKAAADKAAADAAPALSLGGGVQMIVGRITSGFGGRWGTVHQGLDIAAPIGTPIHVPEGGTVISSGPASGFGLWVRVQHPDGTITVYGHINRSFVKVGQKVNAGDVIAETGNRGQSTGPHLHIGVMQNGQYVNPQPWLDAHGIGY
ncbi:M23 family metallopeptidase [Pseudonocardia sp. CA-107938]|uniref:M23 family metallopeptidase n=1 Tax=Pseudonocardia sp. CA-107938 TaxID=3240021 RepID=UPI003D948F1A